MGVVIQVREFDAMGADGLVRPIIYCSSNTDIEAAAVSLNIPIAERLAAIRPRSRSLRLEACFADVVESLPPNSVIKDFDVLFNPDYKVDILKVLTTVCRRKAVSVVWPGTFKDRKLLYAENESPDFHAFCIDDYDVTCIV